MRLSNYATAAFIAGAVVVWVACIAFQLGWIG